MIFFFFLKSKQTTRQKRKTDFLWSSEQVIIDRNRCQDCRSGSLRNQRVLMVPVAAWEAFVSTVWIGLARLVSFSLPGTVCGARLCGHGCSCSVSLTRLCWNVPGSGGTGPFITMGLYMEHSLVSSAGLFFQSSFLDCVNFYARCVIASASGISPDRLHLERRWGRLHIAPNTGVLKSKINIYEFSSCPCSCYDGSLLCIETPGWRLCHQKKWNDIIRHYNRCGPVSL